MSTNTIPIVRCASVFGRRTLEHPADVGSEEIKRAYRRLALRHHPDVCQPSRRAESTEHFLERRRAYETLSVHAAAASASASAALQPLTDALLHEHH